MHEFGFPIGTDFPVYELTKNFQYSSYWGRWVCHDLLEAKKIARKYDLTFENIQTGEKYYRGYKR